MIVLVDGKKAMLKSGFSLEYISENRLFSGRDGYTLSITFPLKDCPENMKIFGHINRADDDKKQLTHECAIIDKHVSLFGSLAVVKLSDVEIECQFAEGRCEHVVVDPFDETYINELDLGNGEAFKALEPGQAWQPTVTGNICVALPWVNNSTGSLQNMVYYDESANEYRWGSLSDASSASVQSTGSGANRPNYSGGGASTVEMRSWQPYLLYIVKAILNAVGYSYDLTAWESNNKYRYLLICNTLPAGWEIKGFARALPHWTVSEFFEKLELFLGAEFDFNHKSKKVNLRFSDDAVDLPPVKLDDIVDEYSAEISDDSGRCEYQGVQNLAYKLEDNDMSKFYSCDWFLNTWSGPITRYPTLWDLITVNKNLYKWSCPPYRPGSIEINRRSNLLYAEDVDEYFVVRCLYQDHVDGKTDYTMELRPLNLLGGLIYDHREDAKSLDIEFVPVRIDATEESIGRAMFLSFGGYDEDDNIESDNKYYQTQTVKMIMSGERTDIPEYYSSISLAWWDGSVVYDGKLPHPHVERIEIEDDWSAFHTYDLPFTLNKPTDNKRGCAVKIDPSKRYSFRFLSDAIPNVRSVFYIKGKRYLCEKITATLTENGLSQLLKGEFYPVLDEG